MNIYNNPPHNEVVEDQRYGVENGFENRTSSTLSFVAGTRTFTITPVGTCYFWNLGRRYSITSPQSIVITDVEGIHFIYYEGDTLKSILGFIPSLITDYALVGVVYWDATNKVANIFGDEQHGRVMDTGTHSYLHNTRGCRWAQGLLPVQVTHGDGSSATDAQIGIEAGSIWDEDINFTPPAMARPMTAPILYRTGAAGDWRKIPSTGYICTTTGSGRVAWNEWTGATWQLTESGTNDFVLTHLVATNDLNQPYIWIVGQASYATLAIAREGADIEWLKLSTGILGELMPEFVIVATFILQTASGYSNAVKAKVVTLDSGESFVDLRKK